MKGELITQRKISPFDGEPYTSNIWNDNGKMGLEVLIFEITPEGAKRADSLASTSVFMLWILCLFILPAGSLLWLIGLIAPFFAYKRVQQSFYNKLAKTTKVFFTPAEFQVKRKTDWEVYDRTLTHSFMMMKHDKAIEERERHELAARRDQMRKQVNGRKRYYDDSYHIIFMYMGQRFDVATIYDQKRATAVTARLKACDKVMDTKNQMGEGEVLSPGEQWGQTPGALPQDL